MARFKPSKFEASHFRFPAQIYIELTFLGTPNLYSVDPYCNHAKFLQISIMSDLNFSFPFAGSIPLCFAKLKSFDLLIPFHQIWICVLFLHRPPLLLFLALMFAFLGNDLLWRFNYLLHYFVFTLFQRSSKTDHAFGIFEAK